MDDLCRVCGAKLIVGENFSEADRRFRKVKCRTCSNQYAAKMRSNRGFSQRLRAKISISLYDHRRRGYTTIGSLDEYVETYTGRCAFCGEEFDILNKDRFKRGSMDRASNGAVVSPENIQWLCSKCNIIKQDMTNEEFLHFIKKIYPVLEKLVNLRTVQNHPIPASR